MIETMHETENRIAAEAAVPDQGKCCADRGKDEVDRLPIRIYFEDERISRPKFEHLRYAKDGCKKGLPEDVEFHLGFLVSGKPSFEIDVSLKDCGLEATFAREPGGGPWVHMSHITQPLSPPLHGAYFRGDDFRACRLIWRDSKVSTRSASYSLFVVDESGLNLRALPLLIGNIPENTRKRMREQARNASGCTPDSSRAAARRGQGECEPEKNLKLWVYEENGEVRFRIFNYQGSKTGVSPEPLFNFDEPIRLDFEAENFDFLEDLKTGKPILSFFNSYNAEKLGEVPESLSIGPLSPDRRSFTVTLRDRPRSRGRAKETDPLVFRLTSFFAVGRARSGQDLLLDPTFGHEEPEDPDP